MHQVDDLHQVHANGEIDVSVVIAKSSVTPPKGDNDAMLRYLLLQLYLLRLDRQQDCTWLYKQLENQIPHHCGKQIAKDSFLLKTLVKGNMLAAMKIWQITH